MPEPMVIPDAGADLPPYILAEYRGMRGFLRWRPFKEQRDGEYKRRDRRVALPERTSAKNVYHALCDELVPWKPWEYPWKSLYLAAVGETTRGVARLWLTGTKAPGRRRTLLLAAFLREKAARLNSLAAEFERLAEGRADQGRPRWSTRTAAVAAGEGLLKPRQE